MAFQIPNFVITVPAHVDLTDEQYKIVVVEAVGELEVAGAGALNAVGVLQNDPDILQAATVMVFGVSKVIAGAALDAGMLVTSDLEGRAVEAGVGDGIVGVALTVAENADEIVSILLTHQGVAA